MVLAAPPIRKLRVSGRPRKNAGFRRWKTPVSASLHRGCNRVIYDFAPGRSNHLYSVATITSSTGSVVERWSYNAYGVQTIKNSAGATIVMSAVGNDRGFTGYKVDSESGLMYARTRMYSAKLGRFISRDSYRWISYLKPRAGDSYADGFSAYGSYFVPNRLDYNGECSEEGAGKFCNENLRYSGSCAASFPPEAAVSGPFYLVMGTTSDEVETDYGTSECPKKKCTKTVFASCECGMIAWKKGGLSIPGGFVLKKLTGIPFGQISAALGVAAVNSDIWWISLDSKTYTNTCDCDGKK